jgi:hypothetical protein
MPTISASRLPGDEFIVTLNQGESLLTMEQQKLHRRHDTQVVGQDRIRSLVRSHAERQGWKGTI